MKQVPTQPSSLGAKPMAWGSQQPQPLLGLRRGFYPNPRPFPSPGEGMQPLASARSVTKVSATHQRVAGRFLTQQSCDCLCSLRSPQCEKSSIYGSCCDCLCSLCSPKSDETIKATGPLQLPTKSTHKKSVPVRGRLFYVG